MFIYQDFWEKVDFCNFKFIIDWDKRFQNTAGLQNKRNEKTLGPFNKAVGPGNRYKINKRRAYVYSGV